MFDSRNKGVSRFFSGLARNRYNSLTSARGLDGEFLLGIVLAAVTVVMLWWTPFLFPFRIYTTSVHEVSHALAAMATGGRVGEIRLFWNGGGVTTVGITGTLAAILVYSAGYLGTVLFGGSLLLVSKRADWRRYALYAISIGLLIITLFFIRDITSLLLVAIVAGLTGVVAWKAPNIVVRFVVYVLALLNCLYSLMDLFWLTLSNSNPFHSGFNDARGLEQYTGLPAFVWSLAWGLLGAFMMFLFVRRAIRRDPRPASGGDTAPYSPSRNGSSTMSPFDRYDDYLSKK